MITTNSCDCYEDEMKVIDCHICGGTGYDGHDCGEDTCCCLNPEDNVLCENCNGVD